MTVALFSDVAGDVVILSDEGDGTFEYWNDTAGTWDSSPPSEADSTVTFATDSGTYAGTPWAEMNHVKITSGDMGTKERVLLYPYSSGQISGAPSVVSIYLNAVVTHAANRVQIHEMQGDTFSKANDSLNQIRQDVGNTPSATQVVIEAAHGSGSYQTATGFATPTNVTTSETNVKNHGDANWSAGGATAGIIPAVPSAVENPSSGTVDYLIDARTYNSSGDAVDADSAPTITLQTTGGTGLESRLLANGVPGVDDTPLAMHDIGVGHYRVTYRASSAHTAEQIVWQFNATISATGYVFNSQTVLTDTVGVDFTSADRAKLDALHDTRATETRMAKLDLITATPASQANVVTAVDTALDATSGAETSVSLRQAIRAAAAAAAGETTAPAPGVAGTVTVKAVGNSGTTRMTATVDANGQRTAVTPNLS